MTQIHELLQRKGFCVWTIDPHATVLEAAITMNEHRIGALVVEHNGRVGGIFTERDMLRRVVAQSQNPAETRVGDVMTADVVCCSPDSTTDDARESMRDRRVRHLPVSDDDGRLLGLISMGDLNADLLADQERSLFLLNEYITGRM